MKQTRNSKPQNCLKQKFWKWDLSRRFLFPTTWNKNRMKLGGEAILSLATPSCFMILAMKIAFHESWDRHFKCKCLKSGHWKNSLTFFKVLVGGLLLLLDLNCWEVGATRAQKMRRLQRFPEMGFIIGVYCRATESEKGRAFDALSGCWLVTLPPIASSYPAEV